MKLNKEQEKIFWESIAIDVEEKLNLGAPSTWTTKTFMEVEKQMQTTLEQLAIDTPKIGGWCNLDSKVEGFGSTMRRVFIDGNFNTTHSSSKNRFTYFLHGMSVEEYIKERNLLAKRIETPPHIETKQEGDIITQKIINTKTNIENNPGTINITQ